MANARPKDQSNRGEGGYYLRLSVTDRCNLRCAYCMPPSGIELLSHDEVLSLEDMAGLVHQLAGLITVSKVRLTGGEPLVRKGILALVTQLADLPSQPSLVLTTNGTHLDTMAADLRAAGIERVNISIDTLDPSRFRALTRGNLDRVLSGIESARRAGFHLIKLNTVLLKGINDGELVDLARFALRRGLELRFIELMPIGPWRDQAQERFLSTAAARDILSAHFTLEPTPQTDTTATMVTAHGAGLRGRLGFISPISHPFCSHCRRLRVDVRGRLHPCLLSDRSFDLVELLRSGRSPEEKRQILAGWLEVKRFVRKPLCERTMSRIGG